MELPVMSANALRWAFNIKKWIPTASEWIHGLNCIQEEERQRIDRFVFKAPALSSLAGRLMLRKAINVSTGIKYEDIKLMRTLEGRPYMPGLPDGLDTNVSHHGSWVVLALEAESRVGVDVMSFDRPVNCEQDEYFRLMRRQFTDAEWEQIKSDPNPLHAFYRFWCLKESYVKAIGVGLNLDLQTISFQVKEALRLNDVIASTRLVLTGSETQSHWVFEESLIDADHCVAVCHETSTNRSTSCAKTNQPFSEVSTDELLKVQPISQSAGLVDWTNFDAKSYSAR